MIGLIHTTKGDLDESTLEKRTGAVDNDNESTTWVEYWLEGELVHRSVHIALKKPMVWGESAVGGFSG